jgi:putative membrane protein
MGLANLVPGISGGTMLLAAGIYGEFIEAVAATTRLRLRRPALLFLLAVLGATAIAIAIFAGPVRDLVVEQRWLAYSLFVGLTLGGVPALWRLAQPITTGVWAGIMAGFVAMSLVGLAQHSGATAVGITGSGVPALILAGAAGAASMILPGISGGYLLLILGQYVVILGAIERAVKALRGLEFAALVEPVVYVIAPVGVGLVLGVALMSNLLRHLLRAHRAVTLGVLLGMLGGVVVGLWPFQEGVPPLPGTQVKGVLVTVENAGDFGADDWPLRVFPPSAGQAGLSVLLVIAGAGATRLVSRVGNA